MDQGQHDLHDRYHELLKHFGSHIQRYCAIHARCGEETVVLMQEVFTAIWSAIGGLRAHVPSSAANRWLHRVMRSVVSEYMHRNPTVDYVPLNDVAHLATDTEVAAEELLDDMAGCLDADERQLIQEFREGYSYAEIAARRGITVDAVRQRMHRLTIHLKTLYTELYER